MDLVAHPAKIRIETGKIGRQLTDVGDRGGFGAVPQQTRADSKRGITLVYPARVAGQCLEQSSRPGPLTFFLQRTAVKTCLS